ncbi:DUF4249 domain-containing protein [Mongoliibacter sp.]|uniref:DUF4249 domain-containing protein n=1 Tax=Mongoliibacter sp. TaxID=2022438 RepID=UPI0025CE563D|nr:DUF4249 domain-containing protein [Mongoliibacter sp.]
MSETQIRSRVSFNNLYFFLLFFFLLGFSACETVVDVDIPFEKPNVTVVSNLKAGQSPEIRLSFSKHILDNRSAFERISDAKVTLGSASSTHSLIYDDASETYKADEIILEELVDYSITVEVPGYETIQLNETIPQKVAIKEFIVRGSTGEDWNRSDEISIIFDDPVGENFYEISAFQERIMTFEDQFGNERTETMIYPISLRSKDPVYQQDYLWRTILFNDRLFDGRTFEMEMTSSGTAFSMEERELPEGFRVSIYIVLKSISKSYYLYENTFNLQAYSDGDPFAQPVQVYTNINGGLGILKSEAAYEFKVREW